MSFSDIKTTVNVGVIFAFLRICLLRENYQYAKIKPICLYEGNRSSIVKQPSNEMSCQHFSEIFPNRK